MSESDETRSVLQRYEHGLYGARDLSLVPELVADPMVRHDAGGAVRSLTVADCAARIGAFFDQFTEMRFRTVHLIVDGPLASWTYELTTTDRNGTEATMSSIEIFEVRDGMIVAVWNAAYTDGPWV